MTQQAIKDKISGNLARLSTKLSFSGVRNTKVLELIGTKLSLEKLDSVFHDQNLLDQLTSTFSITAPTYVLQFIEELFKSEPIKSIFDPCLTISSPMLYMQAEELYGTCIDQREYESINNLFKEKSQNFKLGDAFTYLSQTSNKFDLVLSFPPFGKQTKETYGIKSQYDFATTLVLECAEKIKNEGKLLFLVPNSFFLDDKGKDALKKGGLYVEAVFAIPSGAFSPLTSIVTSLILVSKKSIEKTFVAEISEVETTNKTVVQNFKSQKEGKVVQLGCLVDISQFKSLKSLVSEKEMQEMGKRIGYPAILLPDISIAINALNSEDSEDVEHLANSIYLPKFGNSPTVKSPSELTLKPKLYYQIQLDETKASAIYIANYFNTAVGIMLRESLEVGAVIQQISKAQLLNCTLYLPDLTIQEELINVDNKIQQFTFTLEELKRNLWKRPKSYNSIAKELKMINQGDKLENWIDTLPFPISSILWHYNATNDNSRKIEHLFHFFEAFSEFLSMLMLSALVQDKEFYKAESHNWNGKDEKLQDWYLRATFGNWNNLTANLSKAIRRYLSDKDKKEHCKNLFDNPSEAFLSMITSKGIVNILFEVANLRNKWKGHGGITSDEDNILRVHSLEQQLNEFRKYIADAFEETRMISPKMSNFEDGVYAYTAKELIGARSPFKEIHINSLVPLDRKKLYLSNSEQTRPLELVPFVKFIEENNAFYFYTSIESSNVRWVSYHYETEAEMKQPVDDELFKVFEFLKP